MNSDDFASAYGRIEVVRDRNETYPTFIPNNLPPKINYDESLALSLARASAKLAKLSGAALFLPNPDLLIAPYLHKEAILSSQIEGTRISLSDFLLSEAKGEERDVPDALEVANHVEAVKYGLKYIVDKPITLELIKEMHRILMRGVRGGDKSPGDFRNIQNWIGPPGSKKEEAAFIPPYPEKIESLTESLLDYLNREDEMPNLIKIALIHYQFETIHPFRDGNGRIGRALITLYLCKNRLMIKPLLYISGYLDENRDVYSGLLLKTNKEGAFEPWIKFFLEAIETQANDSLQRATKLLELKEVYRKRTQTNYKNPRITELIDHLFTNPYITVTQAQKTMAATYPTARKAVDALIKDGILKEMQGTQKPKIYVAEEIRKTIDI